MNELALYFKKTAQTLSEGMKEGAYNKLKKAYPNFFKETNDTLDADFTFKGIDKYREVMIEGFKKVNMWKE
jgi:uncharacterized membrane protein YvbJ